MVLANNSEFSVIVMRRELLRAACAGILLMAVSCAPPAVGTPLPDRVRRSLEADIQQVKADAARGDAKAEFRLGLAYFHGVTVRRDYDEALAQFQKSAAQGYYKAEDMLGFYYAYGIGVTANADEAIKWYTKAATAGDPVAQANLGLTYEQGQLVPVDLEEAARWYRLAADQDHAMAQAHLGWMALAGKGLPANEEVAKAWLARAAAHGDPEGLYFYSRCFDGTDSHPPDHAEILKWLTLAEPRLSAESPLRQQAVDRIQYLRARMTSDELKEVQVRVDAFRPTPEQWDILER